MNINMKAILLAAGRGTRLKPLTIEKPKCLINIGKKTIIERQILLLKKIGIKDILVITGYQSKMIEDQLGNQVRYKHYKDYNKTNNLNTLWSARNELTGEIICLFTDLLFEYLLLEKIVYSEGDICLAVNTKKILEGTMRVRIKDSKIVGVGSHIPVSEGSGNFLGIAKFSTSGTSMLLEQMKKMVTGHQNDYYTIAIDTLAKMKKNIDYVDVSNFAWREVDTKEDLILAQKEFG